MCEQFNVNTNMFLVVRHSDPRQEEYGSPELTSDAEHVEALVHASLKDPSGSRVSVYQMQDAAVFLLPLTVAQLGNCYSGLLPKPLQTHKGLQDTTLAQLVSMSYLELLDTKGVSMKIVNMLQQSLSSSFQLPMGLLCNHGNLKIACVAQIRQLSEIHRSFYEKYLQCLSPS